MLLIFNQKMPIPPIVFPEKNIASIQIPVRIADINYGNHVGNDAFVSILHEARVQWLTQAGFSELNAGGVGLIMKDLFVSFKKEAFYGDQFTIELAVQNIAGVSFELMYRITTIREEKNILIALAFTTMVCYDY
ncbi:MAG: acyl-CoA thioesterase, partial [Ferruginibacter sp.]